MSNLEKYIKRIKEYISKNEDITETEIIRYVYLDLGKKLSFNENFIPFGNSKKKQNLYNYHSRNIKDLEECMESKKAICKSISYIFEHVLKNIGIDARTITDANDERNCPHTFNLITQKDGKQYLVDLQEDIYNIQSHSFTKNFGASVKDNKKYVISKFEQEQMDRKNGYINNDEYYSNDYLHLLKYDSSFIEDFNEKVRFILENIDVYDNPNMGYTDRQWHHKTILEEFFNKKEFDYQNNSGKIKMIDCYKDIDNKRHYINCITVQTQNEPEIYIYNKKEYKYCQMNFIDFARAVKNGVVLYKCNIQGLNKAIRNLNEVVIINGK
ncbi:MAG: hypothetical protein IKG42_04145 [Clostridia bacterium]|nr:hypothetical protein [Clostridia bacterium]